ncbi:MAG TPA: SPFH domain-containing protein [Bacteroidales bacterium]|nr:SPFH domain-containing protein [Bacteroidales bacterium]
MGIFNKIRGEFIDIIEWLDPTQNTMVHRFERYQNEIKNGAKLTVRESQVAVFINEGQIADIFQPGLYTLTTENLPILTTLKGWKYGFNSPFLAEVYFVNTKQFTDLLWGTPNPVMLRDPEFGPIRIRANGNYTMKISDPALFIRTIAGTDGAFTTESITTQLRNVAVTRFTDTIGESHIPVLDMASNFDELSKFCENKMKPEFLEYGIDLLKFLVASITLPENVEAALDKRSSMGIIGDMSKFTQFQMAQSMEAAANNPNGGGAAAGMGMGMGFGMANAMMGQMGQANQQQQQAGPPPIPGSVSYFVAINGKQSGPFDINTLKQMAAQGQISGETLVWKQGMSQWTSAASQPDLTGIFGAVPPPIPGQ